MKFRVCSFLFAALICDQAWSGPRMIAMSRPVVAAKVAMGVAHTPRSLAPFRYTAGPIVPASIVRPGASNPIAIRYGSAGQIGNAAMTGVTGMAGVGGMPSMTAPQTQAPPQQNMLADLMKGLGFVPSKDAKALQPSENPVYSPGPAQVPRYRHPREIPVHEQVATKHAPQCSGESAGALLIGTKACNAVYVGDGLAITNWHCTCKDGGQSLKATYSMIKGRQSETFGCSSNVACAQRLDYAIISCPDLKGKVAPVKIADRYPTFTERTFIPTHDFSSRIVKHVRSGPMTKFYSAVENGSQRSMKSYAVTIKGNSGSGVHGSDGEMIGLVWGGHIERRENTLFTPMMDIMDHLKRNSPQIAARIEKGQKGLLDTASGEMASACAKPPPERAIAGLAAPATAGDQTGQPVVKRGRD